jgi:hypothetical protein
LNGSFPDLVGMNPAAGSGRRLQPQRPPGGYGAMEEAIQAAVKAQAALVGFPWNCGKK